MTGRERGINMSRDELLKKMKEFSSLEGEKMQAADLIGKELVIEKYVKVQDYYAIYPKDFDGKYFFSGSALTQMINEFGENTVGLHFKLKESVRTNSGRNYTPIEILSLDN